MALTIDTRLATRDLVPALNRVFELSADKIASLHKSWKPERGAPVFTVGGQYTARGWTDWTAGLIRVTAFFECCLDFRLSADQEQFLNVGVELEGL